MVGIFSLGSAHADNVTWGIVIKPVGSGTIDWEVCKPYGNCTSSGTLTKSGKLNFEADSYLNLYLQPLPAGDVDKVFKNGEDWTNWDGSYDYEFGPVTKAHLVVVTFCLPPDPTGVFSLGFPEGNTSLTPVADLSGVYDGYTQGTNRHYNVSVAQDEAGKLMAVGTVDGVVQTGAVDDTLSGNIGSVSTVNGEPTVSLKGSFKGTKDGTAASSSGTLRAPAVATSNGDSTYTVSGDGSYSAKSGVAPAVKGKNQNIVVTNIPAASVTNIKKDWTIAVTIASLPGKSGFWASAILSRHNNDDTITFTPAKKVKYSTKKGYNVSFAKGMSAKLGRVDKKTSIKISNMLLETNDNGTTWVHKAGTGTIKYNFSGQKGTGNLDDFM